MSYKASIVFLFLLLGPGLGWAFSNVGLVYEKDETLLLIEPEKAELGWVMNIIKKSDKNKSKKPNPAAPFFKTIIPIVSSNFIDKVKPENHLWSQVPLFILFHSFLFYDCNCLLLLNRR